MTISDIRRNTARIMATRVGGPAEFARNIKMSDSQVSQIIGVNFKKNIGNMIARRIEESYELPRGWLDEAHQPEDFEIFLPAGKLKKNAAATEAPEVTAPVPFYIAQDEIDLINGYRQATPMGQLSIRAAVAAAEKRSAGPHQSGAK